MTEAVKKLCMEANYYLGEDVKKRIQECMQSEESPTGKEVIEKILENIRISQTEQVPLCQDTGFAVEFVELGQEVHLVGGDYTEAINEGVRQGYREGYLRKSIVSDPIERKNTGDNTPAVIYTDIVPGDRVKILVAPKGGGSENMSEVKMMAPAAGLEGVKEFVVDRVRCSGANPCPPVIVGVGIGGTFEKCAQIAKKALLRPVGSKNPNPFYAKLEEELLEKINKLGIGPQGFGGRCTALAVHIEVHPCHIASFPVAVNMQCHVARHKEVVL
ncbi:MAG: fumarate hydratase [Candidatus Neomarinimicrobiota bacterium]|nr:MAG: fumarate hydratase [Candidatus Neomarinimicrobiota bacterium]